MVVPRRSNRGKVPPVPVAWIGIAICVLVVVLEVFDCISQANTGTDDSSANDTSLSLPAKAALKTEAEIPVDGTTLRLIDTGSLWDESDLELPSEEGATHISMSGTTVDVSPDNESVEASDDITITSAGTYVLSGSGTMPIIVDASPAVEVRIILDNANVTVRKYAAIYAKSASKVVISSVKHTKNKVSSSGDFLQRDGGTVAGTISTDCDLTINGAGRLTVTGTQGNGIECKGDLRLVSGKAKIATSKSHAIHANGSVAFREGEWYLSSQQADAVHADNSDDPHQGWVYVGGGLISIDGAANGITSTSYVQIDDAESLEMSVSKTGIHASLDLAVNGGGLNIQQSTDALEGGTVTITDGLVSAYALNDAIIATSRTAGSEADGMRSDRPAKSNQGSGQDRPAKPVRPPRPDGTETSDSKHEEPKRPDKPANPSSTDDDGAAQHSASQADESHSTSQTKENGNTAIVTIAGGEMEISSGGDGIDSQGLVHVTGGRTFICGPVSDGHSAVSFKTALRIDGGEFLAIGSSSLVQPASPTSEQPVAMVFLSMATGDPLTVTTPDDVTMFDCLPEKGYSSLLFSSALMEEGKTYDIAAGDMDCSVTLSGRVTESGDRIPDLKGMSSQSTTKSQSKEESDDTD